MIELNDIVKELIYDQEWESIHKCAVDLNAPLPPIEPAIMIVDHKTKEETIFGTLGNFSLIKGKAKSRKSFLLSIIVSNLLSEAIFFETLSSPRSGSKNKVLYIDTEQSDWHVQNIAHRILKLSGGENQDWLMMYKFRSLMPVERLKYTEKLIKSTPDLKVVVIDGIRDLITSINDEAESSLIASMLLKWSEQYNVHIITILHENPTNDKARGHLGTELSNKAETVVQVEVDAKQEMISVVKPFSCRNKEFPPFAFNIQDNLPNILVGFDASRSNTKQAFNVLEIEDGTLKDVMKEIFKDTKEIMRSELKNKLQNQLQIKFTSVKQGLGLNKIDSLLVQMKKDGLIFQETTRKPFKLNLANS